MSFLWSVKDFVFQSDNHVGFCAKEGVFVGNSTAQFYLEEICSRRVQNSKCDVYSDRALSVTTRRDWFRAITLWKKHVKRKLHLQNP